MHNSFSNKNIIMDLYFLYLSLSENEFKKNKTDTNKAGFLIHVRVAAKNR